MKKKELGNHKIKPMIELEKEMRTRLDKLDGLKFDLAAGKVKNIREIRHVKKDIAQLLTLLKAAKVKKDNA
jgi:ribosomal protein L29